MSKRISRTVTVREYAGDAADRLESVRDAVRRGTDWSHGKPGLPGELWGHGMRKALVRDTVRAMEACKEILDAVEFELDGRREIEGLTRQERE